jgi:hypothetical protein
VTRLRCADACLHVHASHRVCVALIAHVCAAGGAAGRGAPVHAPRARPVRRSGMGTKHNTHTHIRAPMLSHPPANTHPSPHTHTTHNNRIRMMRSAAFPTKRASLFWSFWSALSAARLCLSRFCAPTSPVFNTAPLPALICRTRSTTRSIRNEAAWSPRRMGAKRALIGRRGCTRRGCRRLISAPGAPLPRTYGTRCFRSTAVYSRVCAVLFFFQIR